MGCIRPVCDECLSWDSRPHSAVVGIPGACCYARDANAIGSDASVRLNANDERIDGIVLPVQKNVGRPATIVAGNLRKNLFFLPRGISMLRGVNKT